MTCLRPLLVFGTRPEAIKMAPVVRECLRRAEVEPIVCLTGQHQEMLAQVTEFFGIRADLNLQVMSKEQGLAELTGRCLQGVDEALVRYRPDWVVGQGDTTTVMAASLAAFYRRVPFAHVEAGLRTGDLTAPWPEEFNRRAVSLTAALHCAATSAARDNLLREGVPESIVHVTGNTVIDALLWTVDRVRANPGRFEQEHRVLEGRRMVLITGHRRENFGDGFQRICGAIARLADMFPEIQFVYPLHLNPNVGGPVRENLSGRENVHLLPPAAYAEFVWLMDRSTLILTDSGGVQEEAPSLRKPVVVMRDTTERPEAVAAGAAQLVGTSVNRIVDAVATLLTDDAEYSRRQIDANPFGDGQAARRIVDLLVLKEVEDGRR